MKSKETVRHYTPAGGVTEYKDSYTDFMCICSDDEKEKSEKCYETVLNEISKGDPKNFLSCVIYDITWGLDNDWTGYIDGIPCDMWCAVVGKITRGKEQISFFIKCDVVEHGMARIWQLMSEAATANKAK